MTTTVRPTAATKRVPMDSLRKTALVGGALYLITFATSIPARILFGPVRNDPNYILGPGADAQVLFAGFLDVMLALACFGTAVACIGGQAAERRGRVGLRRLPGPGSRHHRRGVVSLLSVVTCGRLEPERMPGHRPGAGRQLRLDVPIRTRFHGGCQRPAAGLPDVPVRPGAADHPAGGADRSAPALRFRYRRAVRLLGQFSRRGSRLSPWPCGSSRWASTWSSRVSDRPRSSRHDRRHRSATRPPPLTTRLDRQRACALSLSKG